MEAALVLVIKIPPYNSKFNKDSPKITHADSTSVDIAQSNQTSKLFACTHWPVFESIQV